MMPDLRYYLSVLARRLHYIALIFFAVLAAAGYVALKLPPVYQSTARLLMESAQIPDDYLALLSAEAILAITMEPPGGAPGGVATGSVVAKGGIQLLAMSP